MHCNDWWPLNSLGKALLKIDEADPMWIHGLYAGDLSELCASVMNPDNANWARTTANTHTWMEANNPEYKEIIARLVTYDKNDDYLMDLSRDSESNTGMCLTQYVLGYKNGPLLADVTIGLWPERVPNIGSALKRGVVELKTDCHLHVDPRYYRKIGLP